MLLRFLTTPILESVHLHHDVAVTAGVYTIWSQAGFLFDVWYQSIKEYYAAQQITVPAAVVDAIFVLVNFLMTYVVVFPLKGGIKGAALAFCAAKLLRSSATLRNVVGKWIWWRGGCDGCDSVTCFFQEFLHVSHFFSIFSNFHLQFFDQVNTICSTVAGTATFIVVCWSKGYDKRTWPGWSFKDGQYPPNFFLYLHDVWFDFPFLTFFLWYDMILIQNDRCDTLQHFCLLPDMQSNSKNVTAFWCFLVEPGDLHWRTLAPFISYDHPSSNWWIGRGVAVSGRCDVVIGTATLICNDLE